MDDPSENSQGDFSPAHGGSETPKQERLRRPQNSFILFSIEKKLRKQYPNLQNIEISRMLGQQWRSMDPEEKKKYEEESETRKVKFLQEHPDYRWGYTKTPKRKEKDDDSKHGDEPNLPAMAAAAVATLMAGDQKPGKKKKSAAAKPVTILPQHVQQMMASGGGMPPVYGGGMDVAWAPQYYSPQQQWTDSGNGKGISQQYWKHPGAYGPPNMAYMHNAYMDPSKATAGSALLDLAGAALSSHQLSMQNHSSAYDNTNSIKLEAERPYGAAAVQPYGASSFAYSSSPSAQASYDGRWPTHMSAHALKSQANPNGGPALPSARLWSSFPSTGGAATLNPMPYQTTPAPMPSWPSTGPASLYPPDSLFSSFSNVTLPPLNANVGEGSPSEETSSSKPDTISAFNPSPYGRQLGYSAGQMNGRLQKEPQSDFEQPDHPYAQSFRSSNMEQQYTQPSQHTYQPQAAQNANGVHDDSSNTAASLPDSAHHVQSLRASPSVDHHPNTAQQQEQYQQEQYQQEQYRQEQYQQAYKTENARQEVMQYGLGPEQMRHRNMLQQEMPYANAQHESQMAFNHIQQLSDHAVMQAHGSEQQYKQMSHAGRDFGRVSGYDHPQQFSSGAQHMFQHPYTQMTMEHPFSHFASAQHPMQFSRNDVSSEQQSLESEQGNGPSVVDTSRQMTSPIQSEAHQSEPGEDAQDNSVPQDSTSNQSDSNDQQ